MDLPKKQTQIIETGRDLFMRYGIRRVSVEEICEKSSVSKMTFYKYYANKLALVEHILNQWFDEGYGKLDKIKESDSPFPAKLEMITKLKLEYTGMFSKEFIDDVLHPSVGLAELMVEMRARNYARFVEFLKEAQSKGELRKEIKPEFILHMLDTMTAVASDEAISKLYEDYVEFTREIMNFLFYGILGNPDDEISNQV